MNKGSAFKWIALIQSGDYHLNDGHYLKWTPIPWISVQFPTYTPCGILEEFIQQGINELDWSGIWFLNKEKSSPFRVSKDTIVKCKAKTDLMCVDDYYISSNQGRSWHEYDVTSTIEFISHNYERL